ncbi:tyrosine recombinase XerC [Rhodococcus sp. ACPA1]|uniref:site-specific integrase n=1 Tax=Rhodococcus sp. ACPA1 TaxID=2028572 RepID=UPI000BB1519F|nr:site-specific integrase [Rhodococcus sp. ACPA1]PBC57032.1 site-specific integrase [Rhodococcus sp. ACPA1]
MGSQRRSFGKIKTLPNGRYWASYVGPDGIRYPSSKHHGQPATYRAKIDAEHWLGGIKKSIDRDTWRAPGAEQERGLTLEVYAEKWLEHRTLKPRTRALYADLLRLHILPALGDLRLAQLSPAAVRVWHAELSTGPTRKAHAYALLHAICATAVADEILDANPCRIRSAMQSKRVRDIDPLSADELQALAWEMPKDLRAAVLLAGWCGLRLGELKGLQRRHIGRGAATVRVERAVTFRAGRTIVDTPKTRAGSRTIAVPPHIRPVIAAHVAGLNADELVFPGDDGLYLGDWEIRRPFKKAAERIGKPALRIHDLRHTGATLAAHAGATTKELMNRLGHTTPAMAMQYQHVASGRDAEIARRLSEGR